MPLTYEPVMTADSKRRAFRQKHGERTGGCKRRKQSMWKGGGKMPRAVKRTAFTAVVKSALSELSDYIDTPCRRRRKQPSGRCGR